jgi:hypothetical protein
MNRIAIKFAALLLLSTGYVMASTTASRPNSLKNAAKTNLECICSTETGELFLPCSTTCMTCCASVGGVPE